MDHKLRLAIVGCGAIAELGHIPAARKLKLNVVALVDTDLRRAQILSKQFGIYKSVSKMEEVSSEVDAVILSTPPNVRPALAEEAFEAGLHALCEKPLANSHEDGRKIIIASKKAGRILAVAHTDRFLAARTYVFTLLQQKAIGKVLAIDIEQGNPYGWQTTTGYTFRRDMVSGGSLLNEGIHSIDSMFWWFGDPLSFEYEDDAIGGLESNVSIRLTFPKDIIGRFRLSRTCKLENRILVTDDFGSITIPLYDQRRVLIKKGRRTIFKEFSSSQRNFVLAKI